VFGVKRVKSICERVEPDLVVIQNDPWNVPAYLDEFKDKNVPIVAIMPVDGKNCRSDKLEGRLTLAIFWTQFGMDEARAGGYSGRAAVIPLGVDLEMYKPIPRIEARKALGLPEKINDAFIVGNVNRNQPRKRLDLTIEYFADWIRRYHNDDAYLLLHVAPTGEAGYDIKQLMRYYGFRGEEGKRLILIEPHIGSGLQENFMRVVYSSMDVQVTTTQGEGWGLTTLEGMACGIPQIVPEWSALGEWAKDAACMIHCPTRSVTPFGINAIGGLPDQTAFVLALQSLYARDSVRRQYRDLGLALAAEPRFCWRDIGERHAEEFELVMAERKVA
jgi:glycosyltransferase involved in cell wall biosynthesis